MSDPKQPRRAGMIGALIVAAAVLNMVPLGSLALAQDAPSDPAIAAPAPDAPPVAQSLGSAPDHDPGQASSQSPPPPKPPTGWRAFFEAMPLPIWIVALSSVMGLVLNFGTSMAALFVTPRNARVIADKQADVSLKSVGVAEKSAQAALQNAEAALQNANAAVRNADISAQNSANLGIHAVARLRQDWINTLRQELADVHSLLSNYREPAADQIEERDDRLAREEQQRLANIKVAKIKLLLNPTEVASQNLLEAIQNLQIPAVPKKKQRRARWIIVWGEIVLKEEWDRVRFELTGEKKDAPHRRSRPTHSFVTAALRGARSAP